MANYVITSGANSFTFEVDGNYGEFESGDLKPLVPVRGLNRELKIKDKNHLLNTAGIVEKELIKIDLDIDSVDVDGVTVFANADALYLALKPVFFLASSSGGTGWDGAVSSRNDLPIVVPPAAGSIYLVENPTVIMGVYTQYQSGLYIRQTEAGALSDWRRLNVKVKYTASEFRVVDSADTTKQLGFSPVAITTGQTRIWTVQNKDIVVAGLDDIPVDSVFGRVGAVVAANDDYRSDQVSVAVLDSSYYDFNFTGYESLRAGEYQFQTLGASISNAPFQLSAPAIYKVRVKANNDAWNSVELDFSTQGDELNQDRKFYRSGQTLSAALLNGWKERILQPQYENLTSLDVLNNNPRVGQTTEGLINNTNVLEVFLDQAFTPRRSGNFTCSSYFSHSLNDQAQDFIANLQVFQGSTLIAELGRVIQIEPKDSAAAGETLNVISGGVITGNANTSTNQRDAKTPNLDADLQAGTAYRLVLSWSGSANGDLATIYSGKTSIKENLIS